MHGRGEQTAHLVRGGRRQGDGDPRRRFESAAETRGFVDTVEAELGPIGIFANNAGIEGVVAPLHEYPDDTFDRLLQVNVKGVFLGLKYVLAKMRPRGRGAIVNTASTSAIRGRAGSVRDMSLPSMRCSA